MAKLQDLSKGDRVGWRTSQGKTTGTVVGVRTKPFSIKGTDLKASKDKPKVVVRSERTGATAGHKPSALQKLKDKVSGTAKGTKAKDPKAKDPKAKGAKAKGAKGKGPKGRASKGKAEAGGKRTGKG
jgi:hypothetical protein